jgi:N-acetylglucosamine-6-phosphate deacetylase
MPTIYTADKIFTGNEWVSETAVVIDNKMITAVEPLCRLTADDNVKQLEGLLVPALIDIQIYGAYGKLLASHPSTETVSLMAKYSSDGGALLCMPTIATNTKEVFFKCIDAIQTYWEQEGKGIWGLHLEGPWINKDKRGAHIVQLIHSPAIEEVEEMLHYGKGIIKMITLAPEVCSPEVIQLIQSYEVIISAGHSNAGFDQAMAAFDNGISTITHLYNAMSPLQHRAPGLVGAAFIHDKVRASIIADGHHVDYAAIKIAGKLMRRRLFAITDAVTDTEDGLYKHKRAGDKYECNGVLSGSALTMHRSFLNLVNEADIEIDEALRMCSLYPAEVLGCNQSYGKIAPHYAGQLVLLNKDLELISVING